MLKTGRILVFPTDTVYGIGSIINNLAIKKLYKIKNRPLNQPTAILMTQKIFKKYYRGKFDDEKILDCFYSGTITLLLKISDFDLDLPIILIKHEKVGIRLPKFKWLEKLINISGPIVASSANIKNEKTPIKYQDLSQNIIQNVDLIIKSSHRGSGHPSSIYDPEIKEYVRI